MVLALMVAFVLDACGEDTPAASNATSTTTAPAATLASTTLASTSAVTTAQTKTTTAATVTATTPAAQKTSVSTTTAPVAASGATAKWCSFLTKDEAQVILEEPALEPTQRDVGPSTNCTYKPVNTVNLNFVVITYFNSDYTQASFASTEQTVADALGIPAKGVNGVGDKANSFDRRLDVLKGSKYFVVQVTNGRLSVDQAVEKARAVALKVVQKL